MKATARASANIALAKYWGKRGCPGNYPAVPSLSVTLTQLTTQTTVEFIDRLPRDEFVLNNVLRSDRARDRVGHLLDEVRARMLRPLYARVTSTNTFPTASGLASSASGFAALSAAATKAAELSWSNERISDLARRASASAARSIYGGYVLLRAGPEFGTKDELSATPVFSATHLPLVVFVCVVTDREKEIGSTAAMLRTQEMSPYYHSWIEHAERTCRQIQAAIEQRDLEHLAELVESNTLAMHASALSVGILYATEVSARIVEVVRRLRACGTMAFFTMDAGPHVKVFVRPEDATKVCLELERVEGVLRVTKAAISDVSIRWESDL